MTIARKVLLRPAAESDLANIYHYIAAQSGYPERAMRYISRIRTFCAKLAVFPDRGQLHDDLRPGLRIIGFERRVVIAYAVHESGDIEIGRIFYGGRDYEILLRDGEAINPDTL